MLRLELRPLTRAIPARQRNVNAQPSMNLDVPTAVTGLTFVATLLIPSWRIGQRMCIQNIADIPQLVPYVIRGFRRMTGINYVGHEKPAWPINRPGGERQEQDFRQGIIGRKPSGSDGQAIRSNSILDPRSLVPSWVTEWTSDTRSSASSNPRSASSKASPRRWIRPSSEGVIVW